MQRGAGPAHFEQPQGIQPTGPQSSPYAPSAPEQSPVKEEKPRIEEIWPDLVHKHSDIQPKFTGKPPEFGDNPMEKFNPVFGNDSYDSNKTQHYSPNHCVSAQDSSLAVTEPYSPNHFVNSPQGG